MAMAGFENTEFQRRTDITMIGVLTYLFGGIDSGFGILILPFVGSSCLLSYGRYPCSMPAMHPSC